MGLVTDRGVSLMVDRVAGIPTYIIICGVIHELFKMSFTLADYSWTYTSVQTSYYELRDTA